MLGGALLLAHYNSINHQLDCASILKTFAKQVHPTARMWCGRNLTRKAKNYWTSVSKKVAATVLAIFIIFSQGGSASAASNPDYEVFRNPFLDGTQLILRNGQPTQVEANKAARAIKPEQHKRLTIWDLEAEENQNLSEEEKPVARPKDKRRMNGDKAVLTRKALFDPHTTDITPEDKYVQEQQFYKWFSGEEVEPTPAPEMWKAILIEITKGFRTGIPVGIIMIGWYMYKNNKFEFKTKFFNWYNSYNRKVYGDDFDEERNKRLNWNAKHQDFFDALEEREAKEKENRDAMFKSFLNLGKKKDGDKDNKDDGGNDGSRTNRKPKKTDNSEDNLDM